MHACIAREHVLLVTGEYFFDDVPLLTDLAEDVCVCRQSAFNLAIAGWLPCGALLALVALSLAKDEAAMQARLAKKVDCQIPHVDYTLQSTDEGPV